MLSKWVSFEAQKVGMILDYDSYIVEDGFIEKVVTGKCDTVVVMGKVIEKTAEVYGFKKQSFNSYYSEIYNIRVKIEGGTPLSIEQYLNRAMFTIEQIAFKDEALAYSERCMEDLARRWVCLNPEYNYKGRESFVMQRALQYMKKYGFNIDPHLVETLMGHPNPISNDEAKANVADVNSLIANGLSRLKEAIK